MPNTAAHRKDLAVSKEAPVAFRPAAKQAMPGYVIYSNMEA